MGPDPFDLVKVRTKHLDAHRRADTGREHVDAVLDGHGPGIGGTRDLKRGVHLFDKPLMRDALTIDDAPLFFRP